MKKRIFSTLLVLCMALTLLPAPAAATPTWATAVTVGGVTLNAGNPYATTNANGVVTSEGATEANYNIKFEADADTSTLTLRNANIKDLTSNPAIYNSYNLTIMAEGTNAVSASGSSAAIYVTNGDLTLKGGEGGGALTAVSNQTVAVYASNITVRESITLTAVGGATTSSFPGDGLRALNDLGIQGTARVTALGGKSSAGSAGSAGIRAGYNVTIGGDATVTAVGGDTSLGGYSAGISAYSTGGTITISGDNAKVVAVGGNAGTNASYGLYANDGSGTITYEGGLLVAKGGKANTTSFAMNKELTGGTDAAVTTAADADTNASKYCVVSPKTGDGAVYHVVTESVSKDTPNETTGHITWSTGDLTLTDTVVIAPAGTSGANDALSMQGMPENSTLILGGFNVLLAGDATESFSAAVYGSGSYSDLTITGGGDLTAISVNGGQCYGIVNAKELSSTGAITAIGGGYGSNYGISYSGNPLSISAGKVIAIAVGSGSSNSYGIEKGSLGGTLSISGGSGVAVGRNSALSAVPTVTDLAAKGAWDSKVMAWGLIPPAAVSTAPTAAVTEVTKALSIQTSVVFALTTYPAGTYKVYADDSTAAEHATVTASLDGNILTLTLTHGTGIPVGTYYVSVTEDGKTESARLALTVNNPPAPPPPPSGGGTAPAPGTPVIVDGKAQNIGTEKKSGDTTTVTLDQSKLAESINNAANGSSVVVPVTESGAATASLVVKNIEDMAEKGMTLTVQTGNVAYNLNTAAIDTAALEAAFPGADMSRVPFDVTITNSAVNVEGETLVLAPVAFTVTATYNGKAVSVDTFSTYIDRVIEVTKEQAGRITTAVLVNADGSTRHVPTNVIEKDGRYYAVVSSRTNSTYALIQNEAAFADAAGKWYEAAVNEMGSRKIIAGRSADLFDGGASITRAEFAAILVRALGLPADGTSSFADVPADAWYTGAVATAVRYGLTDGKGENRFDPNAGITRQEAMAMLQRAAKLTDFAGTSSPLSSFADADSLSTWALDAAKWSVGSGLIQGADGKLNPTSNITRAESAAIILRLLQKAELVDVRSKV